MQHIQWQTRMAQNKQRRAATWRNPECLPPMGMNCSYFIFLSFGSLTVIGLSNFNSSGVWIGLQVEWPEILKHLAAIVEILTSDLKILVWSVKAKHLFDSLSSVQMQEKPQNWSWVEWRALLKVMGNQCSSSSWASNFFHRGKIFYGDKSWNWWYGN